MKKSFKTWKSLLLFFCCCFTEIIFDLKEGMEFCNFKTEKSDIYSAFTWEIISKMKTVHFTNHCSIFPSCYLFYFIMHQIIPWVKCPFKWLLCFKQFWKCDGMTMPHAVQVCQADSDGVSDLTRRERHHRE